MEKRVKKLNKNKTIKCLYLIENAQQKKSPGLIRKKIRVPIARTKRNRLAELVNLVTGDESGLSTLQQPFAPAPKVNILPIVIPNLIRGTIEVIM